MFIITETPSIRSVPQIKKSSKDRIRMECVLQTCGDVNRNKRRYSKDLIESGLANVLERITEGSFLGELDHPVDTNPVRQISVLFKEASHRILETGWDGNKLIGVLETLRTPNGNILKNLAEDGIPVGYSFRGMGDLKQVSENGGVVYDVQGPLHVVTWDAVSFPSHKQAKIIRITESVATVIHEVTGVCESNGMICTNEGYCYFPNEFDKLIEQRMIKLVDKFKI